MEMMMRAEGDLNEPRPASPSSQMAPSQPKRSIRLCGSAWRNDRIPVKQGTMFVADGQPFNLPIPAAARLKKFGCRRSSPARR
jgi:hypothetical protein